MAKPLLDIHCEGIEEPYCPYPVKLKVLMDDGTVQSYILENKTEYQFRTVMESVERMMVGYRPPEQRKRRYRVGKHDTVR